MGTLIRLLLRYSGYDVQVPAYLSVVSKTIEAMPSRKMQKMAFRGISTLSSGSRWIISIVSSPKI